jgi:hypothetical protein
MAKVSVRFVEEVSYVGTFDVPDEDMNEERAVEDWFELMEEHAPKWREKFFDGVDGRALQNLHYEGPDYVCPDCERIWGRKELLNPWPDIPDLAERVQPGEPCPAGECPECGALVCPNPSEED